MKENQIIDLLNESESYFEGNLNAAANNMSMLTMHTLLLRGSTFKAIRPENSAKAF